MAMGTKDDAPNESRVKTETKPDPTKLDTTVASETAAQAIVDASPLVPDADRVAMVSRDKDGNPHQSENYAVLIGDDVSDRVKDAAHNKPGEALGAKHVKENRP